MSRYIDRRNNNFKPVEPIYFSLKGQIEVKISQVKDFLNDCGHIQTFETIQNDAKLFYGKVIFLSDKVFSIILVGNIRWTFRLRQKMFSIWPKEVFLIMCWRLNRSQLKIFHLHRLLWRRIKMNFINFCRRKWRSRIELTLSQFY